jgi:hypothetical protein
MEAVRTNPATAKKTGVPQSVGEKFHAHGKVGALPERVGKKTKTLKRNSEHWS